MISLYLWQRDSPDTSLPSPCKSPLSRFPFLLSPPLSSPTASDTLEFWFFQSVQRPFRDLIVLPVHLSHRILLVSLQDFSVHSHYNMLPQFTPAEYLIVLCLIPLFTPSCSSIGEVGRRPDGPAPFLIHLNAPGLGTGMMNHHLALHWLFCRLTDSLPDA